MGLFAWKRVNVVFLAPVSAYSYDAITFLAFEHSMPAHRHSLSPHRERKILDSSIQ